MEIKLTLLTLVFETDTSFFAAITIEWYLRVFEFELVVWVDWMGDFFVNLHGSVFLDVLSQNKCVYMGRLGLCFE